METFEQKNVLKTSMWQRSASGLYFSDRPGRLPLDGVTPRSSYIFNSCCASSSWSCSDLDTTDTLFQSTAKMATTTDAPPNVLSAGYLASVMVASLPKDVETHLKAPADAIALAVDGGMKACGFRLIGLGEEHRIENPQSDPNGHQPLPSDWNKSSSNYSFRYAHRQSSMEYLLNVNRMGNKVVIIGIGIGDDKTCSFDVRLADYVSDSSLPATFSLGSEAQNEEAKRRLIDVFISVGRLSDFGSLMRLSVIQKLIPSLQKEGYEETLQTAAAGSRQRDPPPERNPPQHDPLREDRDPPAQPYPLHDPLAQPRRPRGPMPEPMPGFEDEYETQGRRPFNPQGGFPRIGDRDLYPQGLGPNDPFRGSMGPGLGGVVGGGGMHPTFDDFNPSGGEGAGAYDPRAPPGARFDPTGPGFGGPRGGGMGGRPPNPFGGFGSGDFI